jgi:hypothetical protein
MRGPVTTAPRNDTPTPPGSLKRESLLAWDLGVSAALGVASGVLWVLTDYTLMWEWFVVPVPLAIALMGTAWHQRSALRTRLQGTDIGEAVRMVDKDEAELARPFSIVIGVALVAAITAAISAIIVETVSSTAGQVAIVSLNVFMITWSVTGVWSLVMLTDRIDRRAARLEAGREELAAAKRALQARRDGSRGL